MGFKDLQTVEVSLHEMIKSVHEHGVLVTLSEIAHGAEFLVWEAPTHDALLNMYAAGGDRGSNPVQSEDGQDRAGREEDSQPKSKIALQRLIATPTPSQPES